MNLFCPETKEEFKLHFERYLSRKIDDYEITREISLIKVEVANSINSNKSNPLYKKRRPTPAKRQDKPIEIKREKREKIDEIDQETDQSPIFVNHPIELPIVKYQIVVENLKEDKLMFDSEKTNVYVHLFGENGDSGRRILFLPFNHSKGKFQKDTVC